MSLLLDQRASQYFYHKLDEKAITIRLIDLLPGEFAAPIYCELVEERLTPSLSYKALSYSWQNDGTFASELIFCNAKPMSISANLHAALRRLRSPNGYVRLWVDAICINQKDDVERAHQVGMMKEIYENSKEVLIWLGERGPFDDMGDWVDDEATSRSNPHVIKWYGDARDIPKLKAYFSTVETRNKTRKYGDDTCDIFGALCVLHLLASGIPVDKIMHLRHFQYVNSITKGLNSIMAKAWWRRIWVVQETVVTQHPTIYYANMCVPWRMFAFAAVGYDQSRVRSAREALSGQLDSALALMQFTRAIMEIESTRRSWASNAPMQPLMLLRKFRSRLATDSRDKIFAVLGIIRSWGKDKEGLPLPAIVPDYTMRETDLFFVATELLIRNTRSLAVLTGTLQRGTTYIGHLPSWVTDWGAAPDVNEHIRLGNLHIYESPDYFTGSVRTHGRWVLEASGRVIDEIDFVGRELESGQGRKRSRRVVMEWEEAVSHFRDPYIGTRNESIQSAFARTLCADLEFVQRTQSSNYTREFRKLDGFRRNRDAFEAWRSEDESGSNRRTSLVGGIWVEPTLSEIETEKHNAFQYLLDCASGGRRFLTTKKGYMGTGPVDMQVGDTVALLMGSDVPFILRSCMPRPCVREDIRVLFTQGTAAIRAGKDATRIETVAGQCSAVHRPYRVVGDCYVQGLVRGLVRKEESTQRSASETIYLT
ncbi:heterokaryon incompatibility protein-domain-containing protein [Xylariaceae sp. FL1272]|nr:heterokaryon incompatibility protein-domain-containing protein [Xylariaceae sp. FL1272]